MPSDPAGERVIDRISDHCDLRQGATNGICPFRDDPRKKRFHLDMMSRAGLLHASVLTVGDEIAASHLGILDGDNVIVGLYTYAPSLARHSPGKFLMLMLGLELASNGFQTVDLTPGGTWKDRFASEHDDVVEATIFFRAADTRREQATEKVRALARRSLAMAGFSPNDARHLAWRLCGMRPSNLPRQTKAILWENREFRIYYRDLAAAWRHQAAAGFAKDRIGDLLCFEPSGHRLSRQAFLAQCESLLADGQHIYSYVEDGQLLHYSWLASNQSEMFFPEVDQSFTYPDNTVLLHDHYTAPEASGRGLFQQCMRTVLSSIAEVGLAERVAVSLPADNLPARHAIEKLGFRHETSLFLTRRIGSVRRWRAEPRQQSGPADDPGSRSDQNGSRRSAHADGA